MNSIKNEYAKYRMERAREALEDAKLLLGSERLNAAVNRIYYGCFYAVWALMITIDKETRRHATARLLFEKYCRDTGNIPKELVKFYSFMFEQRNRGDYQITVIFDSENVTLWLSKANELVSKVACLVDNLLSDTE